MKTISQHILTDRATGGTVYCHLHRSHKKRKERSGSYDYRGQIKGRVSIGDWKIDTIIRKKHKGALLTVLKPYEEKVFTITSDNGQEFVHHESIKEQVYTLPIPLMPGSEGSVKLPMVLFGSTSRKE